MAPDTVRPAIRRNLVPPAHLVSHNPATVHAPAGGYCMGLELTQYRRLLFISGQVPERLDGTVPKVSRRSASRPGAI